MFDVFNFFCSGVVDSIDRWKYSREMLSLSLGLKKRGTRQEEGGGPLMLQLGRRYRFWHNNSSSSDEVDEVDEVTMTLAMIVLTESKHH